MKLFSIFLLLVGFQTDVPFKPSDEFQVNIDLAFKVKDTKYGKYTYDPDGDRLDKVNATPTPFLTVTINQIKFQSDEVKVSAVNSLGKSLMKKKISPDLVLHFDMGFVDDLKNRTSAEQITVYFLSAEKKELRKIVFSVTRTGVFEVNGMWHGQF
jgi:hypothetical protein